MARTVWDQYIFRPAKSRSERNLRRKVVFLGRLKTFRCTDWPRDARGIVGSDLDGVPGYKNESNADYSITSVKAVNNQIDEKE
jgi:hypothetical protein